MSNDNGNGFLQLRRGLLEHLKSGRMSPLMHSAFDLLLLLADTASGMWIGSAKALAASYGSGNVSERQARRTLEKLESAGYIKRFATERSHKNYPILIARYLCTWGAHSGTRLNIENTTDPRNPAYEGGAQEENFRTGGRTANAENGAGGGAGGGAEQTAANDSAVNRLGYAAHEIERTGGRRWGRTEHSKVGAELSSYQELRSKKKEDNKNKKEPTTLAQQKPLSTSAFDEFWDLYPRKIGKQEALKAWLKVAAEKPAILKGLAKWNQCGQWTEMRFIPHPATFLNKRRWEDTPSEGENYERESSEQARIRRSKEALERWGRGKGLDG